MNNNNNLNIITPPDKNNLNSNKINISKGKVFPIIKLNPINKKNNNNNIDLEKKSISEDIRNKLEKINLCEMTPDWFTNKNNYNILYILRNLKNLNSKEWE